MSFSVFLKLFHPFSLCAAVVFHGRKLLLADLCIFKFEWSPDYWRGSQDDVGSSDTKA